MAEAQMSPDRRDRQGTFIMSDASLHSLPDAMHSGIELKELHSSESASSADDHDDEALSPVEGVQPMDKDAADGSDTSLAAGPLPFFQSPNDRPHHAFHPADPVLPAFLRLDPRDSFSLGRPLAIGSQGAVYRANLTIPAMRALFKTSAVVVKRAWIHPALAAGEATEPLGLPHASLVIRSPRLEPDSTFDTVSWADSAEQMAQIRAIYMQEIAAMWSLDQRPNISKLVGYYSTEFEVGIVMLAYHTDLASYLFPPSASDPAGRLVDLSAAAGAPRAGVSGSESSLPSLAAGMPGPSVGRGAPPPLSINQLLAELESVGPASPGGSSATGAGAGGPAAGGSSTAAHHEPTASGGSGRAITGQTMPLYTPILGPAAGGSGNAAPGAAAHLPLPSPGRRGSSSSGPGPAATVGGVTAGAPPLSPGAGGTAPGIRASSPPAGGPGSAGARRMLSSHSTSSLPSPTVTSLSTPLPPIAERGLHRASGLFHHLHPQQLQGAMSASESLSSMGSASIGGGLTHVGAPVHPLGVVPSSGGLDLSQIASFSLEQVVILAFDIARGLEAIHAAGFAHGDLAADNIYLSAPFFPVLHSPEGGSRQGGSSAGGGGHSSSSRSRCNSFDGFAPIATSSSASSVASSFATSGSGGFASMDDDPNAPEQVFCDQFGRPYYRAVVGDLGAVRRTFRSSTSTGSLASHLSGDSDIRIAVEQPLEVIVAGFLPRYAAPEHWRNTPTAPLPSTLAPDADVYAFGILLWELLTSRPAWEGLSSAQIRERVLRGDRPRASFVFPASPVRTRLLGLVHVCCEGDGRLPAAAAADLPDLEKGTGGLSRSARVPMARVLRECEDIMALVF
ncbi:serine/threonine protein kinase, variant [Fonticula alba]|nr:serine/threonine protein kinase, variant [Fonticula alba]KCV68492.1 serine/threonine protein kinase, variant [Fonticula alba]|eukprot:XP_009496924.1 serine/threonine protein kinase, variant [Fonticula alba]